MPSAPTYDAAGGPQPPWPWSSGSLSPSLLPLGVPRGRLCSRWPTIWFSSRTLSRECFDTLTLYLRGRILPDVLCTQICDREEGHQLASGSEASWERPRLVGSASPHGGSFSLRPALHGPHEAFWSMHRNQLTLSRMQPKLRWPWPTLPWTLRPSPPPPRRAQAGRTTSPAGRQC